MKGVLNKKAINSIVEPLKAISTVFENNVHVVFENESKEIFVCVCNKSKGIYSICKLNAAEFIENFESTTNEIGIWDVKTFIDILAKYGNDIYTDNVNINCDGKKLMISCGKENTDFYLGQLHLFQDYRTNRTLNMKKFTEACTFTLDGATLKKMIMNFGVFAEQDIFTLTGEKGANELTVTLSTHSSALFNRNRSVIDNVEIHESFDLNFQRATIKGLLSCNNSFEFTVFKGEPSIIQATYKKDNYDMKFYVTQISNK